MIARHRGRGAAFEDDRRLDAPATFVALGHRLHLAEVAIALGCGQPYHLEWAVALDLAVGVVVDRLAGPGQEPGRGVVVAEDQVRVRLAALERDPHAHLSERASGERVGAAEGLRTEQDVDAEGAALPHEPVQDQRRVLPDLVILDKELLELIDHQQCPRHRLPVISFEVARQILHAELAEDLASVLELVVQTLKHAETELAIALDGDGAGVGQAVHGIRLEFHALLEVDQVELDLVRTVPERKVGDEHVQQRGLSGAGLARDQRMLVGALPQRQVLKSRGAGPPQRHPDHRCRVGLPAPILARGDDLEGHLDPARVQRALPDQVKLLGDERVVRRRTERQGKVLEVGVLPDEAAVLVLEVDRVVGKLRQPDAPRQLLPGVPVDQGVYAAAGATGEDAGQAAGRRVTEVGGKVTHHHEAVGLGDLARVPVVLRDRLVFIAQVLLDDVLHVLGKIGETLLDVPCLRPDLAADQLIVVVGQVHEARKVLTEPDGIQDREADLSRRDGNQQPHHDGLQRLHGPVASLGTAFHQQRAVLGQ